MLVTIKTLNVHLQNPTNLDVKRAIYAQNYWVFGLCPSSGILENREHEVSDTGTVSVLKRGGKTPTQLVPLEKANLNHWTPLSDLHSYLIT
jgi:hypothetical protein